MQMVELHCGSCSIKWVRVVLWFPHQIMPRTSQTPLHVELTLVLVFSKCFRAGYVTFSQLKFKVNKGINL